MEGVDGVVHWFVVDQQDCGVLEALNKIINGGDQHCVGGRPN